MRETAVRHTVPFFSVIIPTYNRPRQLVACLQALAQLDYPRDRFEVIVVDDGGAALLEPVVQPFSEKISLTLLHQPHAGPATARNTGASRAQGRYLAFTDDDCTPAADWLSMFVAHFAMAPEAAVVGDTVNVLTKNPYAAASQHLVSFLLMYHRTDADEVRFWTTSNLALPVEQFHLVGGFDPTFPFPGGEDVDLCARWLARGHRVHYAPEVVVSHAHQLTLSSFLRQHFLYGRGEQRLRVTKGDHAQIPAQRHPVRFVRSLGRSLSSQGSALWALPIASLLLLAQAAKMTGGVWERVVALWR